MPSQISYDHIKSTRYKVVCFIYLESKTPYPAKLDIFSYDTGKWVRRRVLLSIKPPPPPPPPAADMDSCIRHAFHLDGMIYKLSFPNYLIRFDLNALSDVAIQLPHKNVTDRHDGFIGMSKGSLYYSSHGESRLMISIWVLEDRCKRDPFWTLRHRISMDSAWCPNTPVDEHGFHFDTYALHQNKLQILFFLESLPCS